MRAKLLPFEPAMLTWPLIISGSALVAVIAVFAHASPLLRSLVTFWYLLVCPGMAFIRLLKLKDSLTEWILAIVLSLALEMVLGLVMVYAHWWQPGWGLVFLILLSLSGVSLQLRQAHQLAGNSEPSNLSS